MKKKAKTLKKSHKIKTFKVSQSPIKSANQEYWHELRQLLSVKVYKIINRQWKQPINLIKTIYEKTGNANIEQMSKQLSMDDAELAEWVYNNLEGLMRAPHYGWGNV